MEQYALLLISVGLGWLGSVVIYLLQASDAATSERVFALNREVINDLTLLAIRGSPIPSTGIIEDIIFGKAFVAGVERKKLLTIDQALAGVSSAIVREAGVAGPRQLEILEQVRARRVEASTSQPKLPPT